MVMYRRSPASRDFMKGGETGRGEEDSPFRSGATATLIIYLLQKETKQISYSGIDV